MSEKVNLQSRWPARFKLTEKIVDPITANVLASVGMTLTLKNFIDIYFIFGIEQFLTTEGQFEVSYVENSLSISLTKI